ncbi:MAG: pyridoxamine 5'-phosphate oxidase family protein [Bacteroidota bacterium]
MSDIFWKEIQSELQKGVQDPGHPFRFFTLGTVGTEGIPILRTVVLRKTSESFNLFFYTDQRSQKVAHIQGNKNVSLLFYHPENWVQLHIEGEAKIIDDAKILKEYWDKVSPRNRRDYTRVLAPGSTVSKPEAVEYLTDKNHFCAIAVEPLTIEYLKIQSPEHVRLRFSRENGIWKRNFLVP